MIRLETKLISADLYRYILRLSVSEGRKRKEVPFVVAQNASSIEPLRPSRSESVVFVEDLPDRIPVTRTFSNAVINAQAHSSAPGQFRSSSYH
jgi:hypothetical protein